MYDEILWQDKISRDFGSDLLQYKPADETSRDQYYRLLSSYGCSSYFCKCFDIEDFDRNVIRFDTQHILGLVLEAKLDGLILYVHKSGHDLKYHINADHLRGESIFTDALSRMIDRKNYHIVDWIEANGFPVTKYCANYSLRRND